MSDLGLAQWPYFGGPRPECRGCTHCVVGSETTPMGATHLVFAYCEMEHGDCPHAGKKSAAVVHPGHYTWRGKECIDVMEDFLGKDGVTNYLLGCVLKYLYRFPKKNKAEDLDKAVQCIEMIKDIMYGKDGKK